MTIAYMTKTKRNIKDEDLNAAAELKRLWLKYKIDNPKSSEELIAPQIGFTQSMFNQLKSGKVTWSIEHALKVARFFNVDHNSIMKIENLFDTDLPTPSADQYAAIKQLDMKASCGNGAFTEHVVVKGELAFKRDFLRKLGVEEKFARVVYADGHSNDPTIKHGCVVLVNTNDNVPKDNNFYLICDPDGANYIKKLIREYSEKIGAMAWIMRSDNANKKEYPDKFLPVDERTTIVGRCVWNDNFL